LSRIASAAQTTGATVEFVHCIRAFENEFDYVYRALKRHGVNASDAEDLAQEVFLVMWRRWADYDTERPLRPWLAGIAFKVAHDHRRRSGREVPGGLVDAEDQAPGAEEHLASARARSLVLKALASLPEKQRTLIVMHDLDGASMREIADTLAVPLFTAYSRLRSARQAFAKSVRRLHTLAAATAGMERLASPRLLLQAERVPPPAPAPARRRVISRVRALTPPPLALPAPRPAPAPPAPGSLRLAPMALGVAAVLGALALAGSQRWLGHRARVGAPALARTGARASRPPSRLASRAPVEGLQPAGVSPEVAAGLRQGLRGYWHLDDGFGSAVARDASGNANDCQLRNLDPAADWTDGAVSGALHLNGHGWLECARYQSWSRLSGELTLAAWVKRGSINAGLRALISRQSGDDSKDNFLLGFGGDKVILNSDPWGMRIVHRVGVGDRWFHVAATHAADGTAKIFINGEEVAHTTSKRLTSISGGTNGLFIGAGLNVPDPNRPTEILDATVDEVVLYDRALGTTEVAALASGVQPAP
jgi:RNA polymerase sigma-70 factor (ECF subfamily)